MNRWYQEFWLVGLTLLLGTLSSMAEDAPRQWGDLKIRFRVAKAYEPRPIPVQAALRLGAAIHDESLIVNPENLGVTNVLVYVNEGKGGIELPEVDIAQQPPVQVQLQIVGGQLRPRISIAKTGDTVQVRNGDPFGHVIVVPFFVGPDVQGAIPPGGMHTFSVVRQPAPIPIACNVTPWTEGKMVVLGHRYAAVSDSEGLLEIKKLPVCEKLAFRIYHERAGRMQGLVLGNAEVDRRNVFQIPIHDGVNDLGIVDLTEVLPLDE
ncbi:MAG: methylamine utilization protein [Pirellulaceae bacterium]